MTAVVPDRGSLLKLARTRAAGRATSTTTRCQTGLDAQRGSTYEPPKAVAVTSPTAKIFMGCYLQWSLDVARSANGLGISPIV